MNAELYQLLLLFIIYSFLGWAVEIAFHAVTTGHYVNRGFLSGPVCPIYGFGVMLVLAVLNPINGNIFILFAGAVVLTSLLELVTGFLLENRFGMRWWDYSEEPFNIKGYVCLKFSIMWGLACVIVVRDIEPLIEGLIRITPLWLEFIILLISYIALVIDSIDTIASMKNYKNELKLISNIVGKLKESSVEIGENITEHVVTIERVTTEIHNHMEKHDRILKAFPHFSDESIKFMLREVKEERRLEIKNALLKKRSDKHNK